MSVSYVSFEPTLNTLQSSSISLCLVDTITQYDSNSSYIGNTTTLFNTKGDKLHVNTEPLRNS